MYKIFMSTARFFVVVGLIFLGACSGCGKDKRLQPRWKPEELENIIDVHPDPSIQEDDQRPHVRDHWEQEQFKHHAATQVA